MLPHTCVCPLVHDCQETMFKSVVVQPGSGKRASMLQFVLPCVGHNLLCCCLKLAAICWSQLIMVQCVGKPHNLDNQTTERA